MSVDLDRLERLHAAATPGPWEDKGIGSVYSPARRKTIAECTPPLCRGLKNILQHGQNAAYIVAACNSLPDLIAELKEARAENGELKRHSEWLGRKLQLRIDNNAELIKQRDYLAKLLGDLCTSQKDGQCPLFFNCPASDLGWSCGNAIQENWLYAAEKAAKEAGE